MTETELHEGISLAEAEADGDHWVINLIRPTIGRGRGRHVYSAQMLRENASNFTGWPMYIDHESAEARRKAGGLPRSIRDLGGRVLESRWNPDVPADPEKGWGKGAVEAKVRPTKLVRTLLDDDPDLLEVSINARATGVRPVTVGKDLLSRLDLDESGMGAFADIKGSKALDVAGIDKRRGSVDWVTEGGAGGKVVALMESIYHGDDEEAREELLDALPDDRFIDYVREHRPGLVESLSDSGGQEEEHMEFTEEQLREALDTDEGKRVIGGIVTELVESMVEERLDGLVEERLEQEREILARQSRAVAQRNAKVRDMRDDAHRMIIEAKLPPRLAEQLRGEFEVVEGTPTAALNLIPDINDEGQVVKTEDAKLAEAVTERIKWARSLAADLNPTRISGAGRPQTDEQLTEEQLKEAREKQPEGVASYLKELGFEEPEKVYAGA